MELTRKFIPTADEVGFLQSQKGPECALFQKLAEQGHYRGRSRPTRTRQGIYAAAPSGQLLASINTTDPRRMETMLRQALARWQTLPRNLRLLPTAPAPEAATPFRPERGYPSHGLVLRVHSRDIRRDKMPSDWRGKAWNRDIAWFRKGEARQFLPANPVPGIEHRVPRSLTDRLVRLHLVDNVRGQTRPFPIDAVEQTNLTTQVLSIEKGTISLQLRGATRAVERGTWPIRGYRDMHTPQPQERGIEVRLLGRARFHLEKEKFTSFELVALGTRWGGTQYNARGNDLQPAPIGFTFTLAGNRPADRVAPAFWWSYRN